MLEIKASQATETTHGISVPPAVEGSCWVLKGGTHIGLEVGPPKSVKPRVPRSSRVSRDLARAQVTPKSGRGGLMGGRLNNWIDSKTQKYRWRQILLCYICKGVIRRESLSEPWKERRWENGSVQMDVSTTGRWWAWAREVVGVARRPPSLVRSCTRQRSPCCLYSQCSQCAPRSK